MRLFYYHLLIASLAIIIGCRTDSRKSLYPCCFVNGYGNSSYDIKGHRYDLMLWGDEYNEAFRILKYAKGLRSGKKTFDFRGVSAAPEIKILYFKSKGESEVMEIYFFAKPLLSVCEERQLFPISRTECAPLIDFLKKLNKKYNNKRNYDEKTKNMIISEANSSSQDNTLPEFYEPHQTK